MSNYRGGECQDEESPRLQQGANREYRNIAKRAEEEKKLQEKESQRLQQWADKEYQKMTKWADKEENSLGLEVVRLQQKVEHTQNLQNKVQESIDVQND